MAKFARTLYGSAPYLKKFRINATMATPGVVMIIGGTGTAGVGPQLVRGTAPNPGVGITVDTGTYTTTQSASMVEGVVTGVINPDALWGWLLSGSTAGVNGTALTVTTNITASSGGTVFTITSGDPVPNSPTMLDGTLLMLTGANAGLERAITAVAATTYTVTVPFPNAIAVGDTAVAVPYAAKGPSLLANTGDATMTTGYDQLDATVATTSNNSCLRQVELLYDYQGVSNGRTTAQLLALLFDHLYNPGKSTT